MPRLWDWRYALETGGGWFSEGVRKGGEGFMKDVFSSCDAIDGWSVWRNGCVVVRVRGKGRVM